MRAILSEPHPSHCHLIPTAVTVCTQARAVVHVCTCVCVHLCSASLSVHVQDFPNITLEIDRQLPNM